MPSLGFSGWPRYLGTLCITIKLVPSVDDILIQEEISEWPIPHVSSQNVYYSCAHLSVVCDFVVTFQSYRLSMFIVIVQLSGI